MLTNPLTHMPAVCVNCYDCVQMPLRWRLPLLPISLLAHTQLYTSVAQHCGAGSMYNMQPWNRSLAMLAVMALVTVVARRLTEAKH